MTVHMSYQVQELESKDLDDAAHLIHNFWGLNVEFEPTIQLDDRAFEHIREDLKQALGRDDQMILVARSQSSIALLGIIRVEMKKGKFRGPDNWGNIVEFYVLPRERRRDVAKTLLDSAASELKKKGIKMLTAEFPTQNVPAASFYERNGFHPFETVFARELE
jgi:ribosomal protein S18 acetylase RimI-like enzyme